MITSGLASGGEVWRGIEHLFVLWAWFWGRSRSKLRRPANLEPIPTVAISSSRAQFAATAANAELSKSRRFKEKIGESAAPFWGCGSDRAARAVTRYRNHLRGLRADARPRARACSPPVPEASLRSQNVHSPAADAPSRGRRLPLLVVLGEADSIRARKEADARGRISFQRPRPAGTYEASNAPRLPDLPRAENSGWALEPSDLANSRSATRGRRGRRLYPGEVI